MSILLLASLPNDNRSPTAPTRTSSPSRAHQVVSWNIKKISGSVGVPLTAPPVRMALGGSDRENSRADPCNWDMMAAVFRAASPSAMMDQINTSRDQLAKLY